MATDAGLSGYSIRWQIKNLSHSWMNNHKQIDSPSFILDTLAGSKWHLRLCFSKYLRSNCDRFFLNRDKDCVGPVEIEVKYQLAILGIDGSVLKVMTTRKCCFPKDSFCKFFEHLELKDVFVTQRETFLPEDTLTVQCTIWNTDEKPVYSKQISAQTVFQVNRTSFVWRINKLNDRKSELKNKFKEKLIEFDLVLNDGVNFETNLIIKIISFDDSVNYFTFKASIVDSEGKEEVCGFREYRDDDLKEKELSMGLFSKVVMENKSRYFPNGALSLGCEYAYSNGDVSYEHCGCGIVGPKLTNEVSESRNKDMFGKEKSQFISFMANDLKSMNNDQFLSDIELRTSTQTFPAHKNILSARSPVFRKMFSNKMVEDSGYVDITDLEGDTVHQMLLYIYTETVDAMQFEIACKLYEAADKYEILTLRKVCSSFLTDDLCPANACDVLILADLHKDDDLKRAVQDFILRCDKEVFSSLEWKHFMTENIQLGADTLYQFALCKIREA